MRSTKSEPRRLLRRARRRLVVGIVLVVSGYGSYRYARSLPGELGFGGLVFLLPALIGFAGGVLAGLASLRDFWRYVMIAPPMEKQPPHAPDLEAVKQLLEHGALPDRPPTTLVPSKHVVLGVLACVVAAALWLTDPPALLRDFVALPLAAFGAFVLARLLWTTASSR